MLRKYFKNLYQRTMTEAYGLAFREIVDSLKHGGECLDCGAGAGTSCQRIRESLQFDPSRYHGIEWNAACVERAKGNGFNVVQGDLNKPLPFDDEQFRCVFGLSVLEHLLNGCAFMRECHRVLEKNGSLILLTPNISTFFTMALLLDGKMPSSGPHPDSNALLTGEEIFKVSNDELVPDAEGETPMHRHLVVFSFRVLRRYLRMIGFSSVQGYGFGLYPFPRFMQPILEWIDPYHCHQMVFTARK
jgi:ubiquinone/menaquinone biosynthesis C-methylase UbiE